MQNLNQIFLADNNFGKLSKIEKTWIEKNKNKFHKKLTQRKPYPIAFSQKKRACGIYFNFPIRVLKSVEEQINNLQDDS